MKSIKDFINDFGEKYNLDIIIDTSYGLNVDRDDNIYDRDNIEDKNVLFLNVSESGTMSIDEYGRRIFIERSFEIGFFKKCLKETDGVDYYNDTQYLLNIVTKFFRELTKEYNVGYSSYNNGVDQLDSNNVAIRLQFTITDEDIDICI